MAIYCLSSSIVNTIWFIKVSTRRQTQHNSLKTLVNCFKTIEYNITILHITNVKNIWFQILMKKTTKQNKFVMTCMKENKQGLHYQSM